MFYKNNFFSQKKSWSKHKDVILKNYLKPYLAKISKTNRPITIIDCFAGKGKFDDGLNGSPLIIMEEIKNLEPANTKSAVRTIFIESKYYNDLELNLKDYKNTSILKGTFEENLDKVLNLDINNNLFIYIDPYGIKSLDFKYFSLLAKKGFNSLEILLNFNSIGFLREACRVRKCSNLIKPEDREEEYEIEESMDIEKMNLIANGNYWIKIINEFNNGIIDFHQAEEKLVALYTEKLNLLFQYLIKIPIRTKIKNIPKYRIIFGTNHPDGLILMSETMHNTRNKMIQNERKGQEVLFGEYDLFTGDKLGIEKKILVILEKNISEMNLKNLYIELIKYYNYQFLFGDYRSKIIELEKEGQIEVRREQEFTKTGKIRKSFDYNQFNIFIKLKSNAKQ